MVDYTKPAFRDVQWNIWKGGKKLQRQLQSFYTNKRVWDRLAAANPMGPTQPAGSSTACKGCAERRDKMRNMVTQLFTPARKGNSQQRPGPWGGARHVRTRVATSTGGDRLW